MLARVEPVPVSKLLAERGAHNESELGIESDVALVLERVHVGTQQESIVDAVLTTGADRKDVSRFQNRTDFLAG